MLKFLRSFVYPNGRYDARYTQFVGWSFVSNILVSTQHALSVHSMLSALDVCNSDVSRSVNYMGKDVIGQLGSLCYMSKGAKLADKKPLLFLSRSHVCQQVSYILMCATPIFDSRFLIVAGSASALTNLAFIGFGAINQKCIPKIALDDNIGEISAKVAALNTLGSSVGMGLGIAVASTCPDHLTRMFVLPIIGIARVHTLNLAIKGIV